MNDEIDDINDVEQWHHHLKRLEQLAIERRRILGLQGQAALDAILDHPQPNALVHSFAEEDLVFLIHDIGPEDSLDLIAMASERQWEYILDVETWEKDRINLTSVTRWMDLMLRADPQRFMDWATTEQPQLVEYLLFHSIEIIIREHDQDPSDFEDGFLTYDDIFYVRIPEDKYAPDAEEDFKKQHQELVSRLMDILAEQDHVFFQQTLLRSANVIPAETEEEAFRLRNFRLAEKGFLPFHEAVGVFQPITVDLLKKRKKQLLEPEPDSFVPAPMNHSTMMDGDSLFSRALGKITDFNILQQLQIEFAGVCNQLIATETHPVRGRNELKTLVRKACGFISIGIERLLRSENVAVDTADQTTIRYVEIYPLIDLFRTGYGEIAGLRQQAKKWQTNSWFSKNDLPLSFWGERMMGVIGGLLLNRPKFYDNYLAGTLYREFETMADVERTAASLAQAMAFDDLLSEMTIPVQSFPEDRLITCENLLLTLWARDCIGLPREMQPIPVTRFRPFFADLWEPKKTPSAIKASKKTGFLQWLASESGRPAEQLSQTLGDLLELFFNEISKNLGLIGPDDLDPRFVTIFLLTGE